MKDLNELVKKAITKIENLTKIVEFNAKSCDESFKAFEFAQEQVTDKLGEFVKEFDEGGQTSHGKGKQQVKKNREWPN